MTVKPCEFVWWGFGKDAVYGVAHRPGCDETCEALQEMRERQANR